MEEAHSTERLKVAIVYESPRTGLRAKFFVDRLIAEYRLPVSPNIQIWRSDLLGEPIFNEQAAVECSLANIILVSLSGCNRASALFDGWLDRWLEHREDRPYAFGLLLDAQARNDSEHPLVQRMRAVTAPIRAGLFCGFYETSNLPIIESHSRSVLGFSTDEP